jgi:hypothetical protein
VTLTDPEAVTQLLLTAAEDDRGRPRPL